MRYAALLSIPAFIEPLMMGYYFYLATISFSEQYPILQLLVSIFVTGYLTFIWIGLLLVPYCASIFNVLISGLWALFFYGEWAIYFHELWLWAIEEWSYPSWQLYFIPYGVSVILYCVAIVIHYALFSVSVEVYRRSRKESQREIWIITILSILFVIGFGTFLVYQMFDDHGACG